MKQKILTLCALCAYYQIPEGYLIAAAGYRRKSKLADYKSGKRSPLPETMDRLRDALVESAGLPSEWKRLDIEVIAGRVFV